MDIFNILIIIGLFNFSLSDENIWRDYPTCKIGRLQSPIEIKEYESIYANNFSFVYQSYKECQGGKEENYAYTLNCTTQAGGYINFERGGVIKQYEFIRAEIYPILHGIDGDKENGDYELHLIHQKNLDFKTNKNQYRSIQDPNMYLVIVLRYSNGGKCIYDNGLLEQLMKDQVNVDLNNYNIFQDKRAYFYEGSFVHIPCDENVNYYIVKDFFYSDKIEELTTKMKSNDRITSIGFANLFGRPVYKNFMNYREVLGNHYFSFKNVVVSFLFIIILL
jgi:carbonic anhydrase